MRVVLHLLWERIRKPRQGARLHPHIQVVSFGVRCADVLWVAFDSHDGRALVPIPKRSTSPWATSTLQWWWIVWKCLTRTAD